MKLLIATIKKLVLWNNEQVNLSEGNYYGLTWDHNNLYASCNPGDMPISVIEIFDKEFNCSQHIAIPDLNAVHQIYSWQNNLYITNTLKNRVDVWDKTNQSISYIDWTYVGKDQDHINSFWCDGKHFYIAESGLAKNGLPVIQILDLEGNPLRRIALPETKHIHNIYIENDTLFSCGKYGLIVKEMNSGKCSIIDLMIDQDNGFFRGLARTKNCFFIGESQELPRSRRHFGDARVLILDNNLKLVDTINLMDTGQIQDLRVLSESDLAHNGINWMEDKHCERA